MKQYTLLPIKYFFKLFFGILSQLFGRKSVLELCVETLGKSGDFITYHFRPSRASRVRTKSDPFAGQKIFAIVMQGGIIYKDDFTLETLKIYKSHSPDAKLILSTWESESPVIIQEIRSLGVEVILNKKPAYSGIQNINLQIASSYRGVVAAQDSGAEYVLKTRTDQRIYAPNVVEFLINILEAFPLPGNFQRQKKRIIGCGLNTFKYRMYGLSDMFICGHIEDIKAYWSAPLDDRVLSDTQIQLSKTSLRQYASLHLCEIYLATEFLAKMGRNLKWTLRDSWEAFADHFCVIDKEQLDMYWPKYSHSEYRWLNYEDNLGMSEELSFREWLNVYSNLKAKDVPEHILDLRTN